MENVVHYAYAELGEMLLEEDYGPPGIVEPHQLDSQGEVICLLAYMCEMISEIRDVVCDVRNQS